MGIVTNIKTGLTVIALTFGLASAANAAQYTAADNSIESKMCVTAATASKMKMHNEIKDFSSSKLTSKSYRLVANKLYCNGINVAEFARQAGNEEIAQKLAKYRKNNVQIRDLAKARHGNVHIGSL